MNMFEFSLSRAIIRSKYTLILTLGAVIGVMCLVIITSLFNNYYLTSENIFMGIHPHIRLKKQNMTETQGFEMIRKLKQKFPGIADAKLALYQEVKAVINRVNKKKFFCVNNQDGSLECFDQSKHTGQEKVTTRYGFTIIGKKKFTVLVKGITVENNETSSDLKKIINGSLRLDDMNYNADENNNPLPWSFYLQQDVFAGTVGYKDFLFEFPGISDQKYHLMQKGTLNMGTQKGKFPLVVMSMKNAQVCLGMPGICNTIEVKLKDPYLAEDLAPRMAEFLGQGVEAEFWIAYSRSSFAFLKIIRIMILAIIFSISVVAAIGMVSTLTLIVMQNRGKIAILKSMGIKESSIYKIFVLNTGLTGVIGVIAGTGLGFAGSYYLTRFFGENLEKLGIKNPQVLISTGEVLVIGILVIALFILTAVVPSKRAMANDVVEGLQVY